MSTWWCAVTAGALLARRNREEAQAGPCSTRLWTAPGDRSLPDSTISDGVNPECRWHPRCTVRLRHGSATPLFSREAPSTHYGTGPDTTAMRARSRRRLADAPRLFVRPV